MMIFGHTISKQGISFLAAFLLALTACNPEEAKEDQTILFENVPAQISITEGSLPLKATSSSGLLVTFTSSDESVAIIENGEAIFRKPGVVSITASQAGNSQFYEAANVVQTFEILSVDPRKKEQTIHFELVSSWKSSEGPILLNATATSGLPVTYTSGDKKVGFISSGHLILEHYYYPETAYTKTIAITASQAGNSEYNPAANVTKLLKATIDVEH
ncbi:hypothetical protein FACS189413_00260 [Bacteroidia bacterium]|nr:hypothetical protein FACS189413_00260 [Bacteroidia bacterium]